jgi:hypothetical protein
MIAPLIAVGMALVASNASESDEKLMYESTADQQELNGRPCLCARRLTCARERRQMDDNEG